MTKLGTKVICKGYLHKTKKKYVMPELPTEDYNKEQRIVMECCLEGEDWCFCEIGGAIEQDQYEIKQSKEFIGIVVDIKEIALKRCYCVDYDDYNDKCYIRTFDIKDSVIKVARVYYRLGKSRLVPCNMLKELISND